MVNLIRFNVAREIVTKEPAGIFDIKDTYADLVFRSVPTMFSFDILFSLAGMDASTENILGYYLVDPNGANVLAINSIKVAPKSIMQQNDNISWNCVINVKNIAFNNEGIYKHIIVCNDEEVCQIPMLVKKALIN